MAIITPAQEIITSGSVYTTSVTNIFIGWNSASANSKTTNIPASTGGLTTIVILDIYGDAYIYPITAVPLTGSVIGVNQVYSNGGSITLLDTSAGWCSI